MKWTFSNFNIATRKRRDIVVVQLENPSTTLRPSLILHHDDKSIAMNWDDANAPGADKDFSFSAEPGKSYYVGVASYGNNSAGQYALSVVPQKAYAQYEPNDDAFAATRLKLGEMIEANIMDGKDVDSYRLSGLKEKSLTVQLENLSNGLRPSIQVLDADKSIARTWAAANANGADLKFSMEAKPGEEYFVEVGAYGGNSKGPYKLTVR
jgi:hypothetical protein